MKKFLLFLLSALLITVGIFFLGCNDGNDTDDGNDGEITPHTVTFTVDGNTYATLEIPESGTLTFPEAPAKNGYNFKGWFNGTTEVTEITSETDSDLTLTASFEPITYYATFKVDGEVLSTVEFNVETVTINPPTVPEKTGYTGAWESYSIGLESITVNAVYTPIVYTATFVADGATVATREFTVENKAFDIPAIPEKTGYYGMWESYQLTTENIVIDAVYTAGDYVVTFMNGSVVVGKVGFTVEDTEISEPSVPFRQCYTGKWESYTLRAENITVNAVYTIAHTALSRVKPVAPQCNMTGNIEYWDCSGCDKYFSDANGTAEITNKSSVIKATVPCSYVECICKWCGGKNHRLTHHDRVDATCLSAGNLEYWDCYACGKNFSDATANNVITNINIPISGCSYVNRICKWCGTPDPSSYQLTYVPNGGKINGTSDNYSVLNTFSEDFLLQQTLHINNGAAEFTRSGYQIIGYSTVATTDYSAYSSVNSITGFSNLGGVCEVPRNTRKLTLYPVWAKETPVAAFTTATKTYNDIWYGKPNVTVNSINNIEKRNTTGIVITEYKASSNSGSKDTVVIPEYVNGTPVIGITSGAFKDSSIKKIVIPKTVKRIENTAFSSCSNLKEVVFFDSLQYVQDGSFKNTVSTVVLNSTKLPTFAGTAEGSFCIKYERVRFYKNEKKLIVLSGSSTLNGLNSKQLEANFNYEYQIVNYGTNAANESTFFLEVISKYTTAGDIVVLAPEWTSGGMMGDTKLHWKMFRGNNQCYDIFREVDMSKYSGFWNAYQTAYIGKALNNSNAESDIAGLRTGSAYQSPNIGMNKYGDLLGSRTKRTYTASGSMMFNNGQMSTSRAANLNYANSLIVAKGGTLLLSFGTADAIKVTNSDSSWRTKADSFTQHCANVLNFPVISNVGTYIMGANDYASGTDQAHQEIYNSEWHCTYYGANVRTVELTYDIKQYLAKKTDSWESYSTRETHRNPSAYQTAVQADFKTS